MYQETDEILNIDQFCELLDIGKNTGYKLLKNGTIKGFMIGKVWKIPAKSVEEFILRETKYEE